MRRTSAEIVYAMLAGACSRKIASQTPMSLLREPCGLLEWTRRYLPEYTEHRATELHRWLAEKCDEMVDRRGVRLNLMGPRQSSKSTIGVTANVLRSAVEGTENLIWIVSETAEQAHNQLETIKDELIENDAIKQRYPWAVGRGATWRKSKLVLRNNVTIEAFGSGQALRGRRKKSARPSLIICDDLQGDRVMTSPARRTWERDWFFSVVMHAGSPRTNFVNLCTALHRDAVGSVLDTISTWTSRRFRSIVRFPDSLSAWDEWRKVLNDRTLQNPLADARALYESRRVEMDAGSEVLWPDREPLYELMLAREMGGHRAFAREKQATEINPSECEWGDEYFPESIWFRDVPKDVSAVATALDPSKGRSDRVGDYSAIVSVFLDRVGVIWVRADLARRPTNEMLRDLVRVSAAYKPGAVGIETNVWQELLCEPFVAACVAAGVTPPPVLRLENREEKRTRIRRLDPLLTVGRLRFSDDPSTRLLVQQLMDFPIGDHDDGPDALEMAVRCVLNVSGQVTSRERIGGYIG